MQALGHGVEDVRRRVHPAALLARGREHLPKCSPAPERPVFDLEHFGTLTRDAMRVVAGNGVTFELPATPTPTLRRAFELLAVPVPRTLVWPERSARLTRIPRSTGESPHWRG